MVSIVRVSVEAGSHDPVQVKLKESEHVVQPGETSGAYSVEDNDTLQVKLDKPQKEEAPSVATPTPVAAPASENAKPSTSSRHR